MSSQSHDATSSNISDYDTFVNGLADAAGLGQYNGTPVNWHALGSVGDNGNFGATLSAVDRLPNSVIPIYDMNGDLVANATTDIWSTATTNLLHQIDYTEQSVFLDTLVWTGTHSDGSGSPGDDLGSPVPIYGDSLALAYAWVESNLTDPNTQYSFYGFSDVITVAEPVPETRTAPFLLASVALLALGRHRKTGESRG